MDTMSVFVIATLMMLANGGVLGLMHSDLPQALRPAAVSWRIGTLLVAGGCMLFAVQRQLPPAFVLPLSNGLVMLGFTGYWRALRQFYGYHDSPLLLLPFLAGTCGIFWFSAVTPDIGTRILIVSLVWLVIMGGCVATLRSQAQRDAAISRRVMAGIFVAVMAFVVLRMVYFVGLGINPGLSVLDGGNLMHAITPMIAAVLPVVGTTAFLLMCSERIRRQWERAASTDYLTGLANRRTLTEAGDRRFAEARQKGGCLALAIVDIDHFKSINDRYGHDIGDVALKHVAGKIELACRERELPARQGGEEFVVLFDGIDAAGAHAAGERLRESVAAAPFVSGDLDLPVTVSIGVAVLNETDHDLDSLLRRADAALYAAKVGGRNRVEVAA
ncbi:MAG: GGDEF domain-containing protein [Moraxellaceae bacterium]|nr:GGDEF domain-containing protein [Moraxellaceae bacterium]